MRKTGSKDRQIDLMDLLDGVGVSVQLTNSRETGQVLWIQLPRTAFLE